MKKIKRYKFLRLLIFITVVITIFLILKNFVISVSFNYVTNIEEPTEIEPFTIALIGTDYGETRSTETGYHSDALIVAEFIPKNSRDSIEINTVSIPRDTYAYTPCLGTYDKITNSSAHGYSSGYANFDSGTLEAGTECTIDSLEILLNTTIDYHVVVTFDTFIDIVDSVGGIELTLDDSQAAFCEQDEYDNPDSYCFEPGETYNMDGSEALSYSRNRSSSSATVREARQQQVIGAILLKLITNSDEYAPAFSKTLLDSTENNLSNSFLLNLLTYSTGFLNYNVQKLSKNDPLVIDVKNSTNSNPYVSIESILGLETNNYQTLYPEDIYDSYIPYESESQYFTRIIYNNLQLGIPTTVMQQDNLTNETAIIGNVDLELQFISPSYDDTTINGGYYSTLTPESHLYLQQVFGDEDSTSVSENIELYTTN